MSAAYYCDNCKKPHSGPPPIRLKGRFQTRRAGIMLPRDDWDFCSLRCFDQWFADIIGLKHDIGVEERGQAPSL